jgi:hypothetical protein
MGSLRQSLAHYKHEFLNAKALSLGMAATGAFFVAMGIHRFRVRPEAFGWLSLLGCGVAAFGAFFLLLITDYLLHHAPLVFVPWVILLIYFAIIEPHLGVGLGAALWFMLATQLRG